MYPAPNNAKATSAGTSRPTGQRHDVAPTALRLGPAGATARQTASIPATPSVPSNSQPARHESPEAASVNGTTTPEPAMPRPVPPAYRPSASVGPVPCRAASSAASAAPQTNA